MTAPPPSIRLDAHPSFQGYIALPLHATLPLLPLQNCLIIRANPASAVALREERFVSVYLACLVDAAGTVHQWLELHCRTIGNEDASLGLRDPSNLHIDQELQRRAALDQTLNPLSILALPPTPSPALFIDPTTSTLTSLQGPSDGQPWELCTRDELLTAAGLPAYSTTDHQYLYCPAASDDARRFLPVSAAAPSGKFTISLEDVLPAAQGWILLTPGGLLSLRAFTPLSMATYADLLAGITPPAVLHGKHELQVFAGPPINRDPNASSISTGRLLPSTAGLSAQMSESLHLKLQALTDALSAVHRALESTQRPFLTLTEADFRVGIATISPNMPALWTSNILLHPPADIIELKVEGDRPYYVPNAVAPSIYTAPAASGIGRGSGSMRLRKITTDASGTVFEGTLTSQERLKAGARDLVFLKLNLGGTPLAISTHLDTDKALARSEYRIKSIPVRLDEATRSRIASFEGAWVEGIALEVIPLLSSPADLFSIAVLAIRTLLVNKDFPLPIALDEVMSLAHETAADPARLVDKIARVFAADPRWAQSLGPQRLTTQNVEPTAALELVPRGLWYEILAWIIQMIPGAAKESYAADFGQATPGRIQAVLEGPIREAQRLIACSRSLIVVDWQMNRTVGAAIRDVLKEVSR